MQPCVLLRETAAEPQGFEGQLRVGFHLLPIGMVLAVGSAFDMHAIHDHIMHAQDYEAALQTEPDNLQILLRQGRVLYALRRTDVRMRSAVTP